jgi:RNA polymerase sigma-70 factor, ECF subfamily
LKPGPHAALAGLIRSESGRVLAALIKKFSSFELAEDALQDAMEQAAKVWPKDGIPENGGAWLYTVAVRRAIDRLRRDKVRNSERTTQNLIDLAKDLDEIDPESAHDIPDERLRLIFTCCHPALSRDGQVALTLKTLGGLSAREIARAFLVSEPAMVQRITRAKRKIADAGIAYEVPDRAHTGARLASVLATLYLIYNESYSAFEGSTLTREDLAGEAIRLGNLLYELAPDPEAGGLLALMGLHNARRRARLDANNTLIPLKDQDRTLWDHQTIAAMQTFLADLLARKQPGPYQIQAAISALHCAAPNWQATDWPQIVQLYDALAKYDGSAVVALNRAVARARIVGAGVALDEIEALAPVLADYQPFFAARAHLLARLGRNKDARVDFSRAIALSGNEVERRFLIKKRKRL